MNPYMDIMRRMDKLHIMRRNMIAADLGSDQVQFSQMPIIRYVKKNENCTQIEISDALNVSPASVALSTKRLEKAGVIKKTVDPNNLRCKRINLTELGEKIIEDTRQSFDSADIKIFGSLTDEEREDLCRILDKILDNLEQELIEHQELSKNI